MKAHDGPLLQAETDLHRPDDTPVQRGLWIGLLQGGAQWHRLRRQAPTGQVHGDFAMTLLVGVRLHGIRWGP